MQREIEKGQEEAKSAELENGKLQAIIRSLEKDIVGLKHEIMERDETIQEKEKRTYDLKKKNQGNYICHKICMNLERSVGKIVKLESSFQVLLCGPSFYSTLQGLPVVGKGSWKDRLVGKF